LMQRRLSIPDIRYFSKWVAPSNNIKKDLLENPETVEMLESVNQNDMIVWEHVTSDIYPKQQTEFGSDLDEAVAAFQERNGKMSKLRLYAHPKYAAYVWKWRRRYRPWVRRLTGDPTAG